MAALTSGACGLNGGSVAGDPFAGVPLSGYSGWTSTEKNTSNVWSVELFQGYAGSYPKTATAVVGLVRPR